MSDATKYCSFFSFHKEDDHKDEIKHMMIPKSVINAGVLLLIHWFAKDWKNLIVTENPKYISKQTVKNPFSLYKSLMVCG